MGPFFKIALHVRELLIGSVFIVISRIVLYTTAYLIIMNPNGLPNILS